MKLSTVRPMTDRDRRARSWARAAILADVASAALTAGDGRMIEFGDRSIGGGAKDASRSASRAMAASPEPNSTGRCAVLMSVMGCLFVTILCTIAAARAAAFKTPRHG